MEECPMKIKMLLDLTKELTLPPFKIHFSNEHSQECHVNVSIASETSKSNDILIKRIAPRNNNIMNAPCLEFIKRYEFQILSDVGFLLPNSTTSAAHEVFTDYNANHVNGNNFLSDLVIN